MTIKNINNVVWVVTWIENGESMVEYFHSEVEANQFIKESYYV